MKIDVFQSLKLLSICIISMFFAFVFQHYINLQNDSKQMGKDLKIAVFVKDDVENSRVVFEKMKEFSDFNIEEFVDKDKSYDKALELNPELADIIAPEVISYPSYFIVNNAKASDIGRLEQIKTELMNTDFISDVIYDSKAFQIFFDNAAALFRYKKTAVTLCFAIVILFAVKLTLFIIKKRFKDIIIEMLLGCLASFCAYVIICISAALTYNPVYVLDWHILIILIPLGAVICFLTKESNA